MLAFTILLGLTAGAFAQSSSYSSSSYSSSSPPSYSSSSSSNSPPPPPPPSPPTYPSYVPPVPMFDGPCPYIIGQTIDLPRMVGPWYEVQRSDNNFAKTDKCQRFLWNEAVNNVTKIIYNSVSLIAPLTTTAVSLAVVNKEGVAITYQVPTAGDVVQERIALDVNYDDHLILWSCTEVGNKHFEHSWIHSRKPTTGPRMEDIKRDAFARYGLSVPNMIYHDTSNCELFYDSYDKCQ